MNSLKSKEFFNTARFLGIPVIATQQGENGYSLSLEQSNGEEVRSLHLITMTDHPTEKTESGNAVKIETTRFFSSLGSIEKTLRSEKIGKLVVKLEETTIKSKRKGNPEAIEALAKAREDKKAGKK